MKENQLPLRAQDVYVASEEISGLSESLAEEISRIKSLFGEIYDIKEIHCREAEIFDDETLAAASISYIMHRIQSESTETGTPALVMIDETAPMLKHEMFRDAFIKGLQEGRKKRQAYLWRNKSLWYS